MKQVIGQIARAIAVFRVDEIIIVDDGRDVKGSRKIQKT